MLNAVAERQSTLSELQAASGMHADTAPPFPRVNPVTTTPLTMASAADAPTEVKQEPPAIGTTPPVYQRVVTTTAVPRNGGIVSGANAAIHAAGIPLPKGGYYVVTSAPTQTNNVNHTNSVVKTEPVALQPSTSSSTVHTPTYYTNYPAPPQPVYRRIIQNPQTQVIRTVNGTLPQNPPPGKYIVVRQSPSTQTVTHSVPPPIRRVYVRRVCQPIGTYGFPSSIPTEPRPVKVIAVNGPVMICENVSPLNGAFPSEVAATEEVKTEPAVEPVVPMTPAEKEKDTVQKVAEILEEAEKDFVGSCARTSPPLRLKEWRKYRKPLLSKPKNSLLGGKATPSPQKISPLNQLIKQMAPQITSAIVPYNQETATALDQHQRPADKTTPHKVPKRRPRKTPTKIRFAVNLEKTNEKSAEPAEPGKPKLKRGRKKKLDADGKPVSVPKRPRRAPMRTAEQKEALVKCFEREGLDHEEIHYLEMALERARRYEQFKSEDLKLHQLLPNAGYMSSQVWRSPRKIPTPKLVPPEESVPTTFPSTRYAQYMMRYYEDPEIEDVAPNSSGCARAQGILRKDIDKAWKIRARLLQRRLATNGSQEDGRVVRHIIPKTSSEQRCGSDRYAMRDSPLDDDSAVSKIKRTRFQHKAIKFAPSTIHGWGLFADEDILENDLIIEYIGERVRKHVAEVRELRYTKKGIGSSYLFRVDNEAVIDSTRQGNYARFINHSCKPNCFAKILFVEGERRIFICAKRDIPRGEELTYDYKFPKEDDEDKIQCLCLVKGCRRFLN